jgi:CheY-like chemotaxis protein
MIPATILYVEDSPDDVLFVERALRKVAPGVRLHVIADGQAAIDYFDPAAQPQLPPGSLALVLLDLNLPGRSGLEVLAHIRKNSRIPAVPVVMFSASNQPKDIDACYTEGCNAYLIKPTDSAGLRQTVALIAATWLQPDSPGQPAPVFPRPG